MGYLKRSPPGKLPVKLRHDSSMTRLDSLGLDCQDATRQRHFRETLSLQICLEHWLSPGLEAETVYVLKGLQLQRPDTTCNII